MANENVKNNKGKTNTTNRNNSKKTTSSKKNSTNTKVNNNKPNNTKKNNNVKANNNKVNEIKQEKKVEIKKEEPKVIEKVEKVEKVVEEEIKTPVVKNLKNTEGTELAFSKDNTPFVISLCVIVILVAALIYCICSKRVPKLKDGSEIVATIKGKDITAEELYESLKESNGTASLITIVDDYIANKEVKIREKDEEYAKEVVNYYKDYAEYYQVDLITFLSNYMGLTDIKTEDEFYDFVLEDYKKTLVVKNYLADNAKEEDLKEYYNNNYSEKLTVKHILIEIDSENEDKDAADKDAYNKAVDLINELNDTSKEDLDNKFNELVENNSDDTTTYKENGLMEDLVKSNIQEPFYNAAYDLKDGEYTKEPVKTSYGYHVILKVSSKEAEKYEDVLETVKDGYADELLRADSTLMTLTWDEIRNKYKLSIKDDIIKQTYEDQIKNVRDSKENAED